MGINPFAALPAVERATFRTALTGHVAEVMYRGWQRDTALHIDNIVAEVQALAFDAPFAEIQRTVAFMECAGLVRQDGAGSPIAGLWVWLEPPRAPIAPLEFCATPGCLRPAGHPFSHLPDLHAVHLSTEMVVPHEDFIAAWCAGAAWVRIYPDAAAWAAKDEPRNVLAVPHTMPYTPAALAALVTAWLGHDEHPGPSQDPFVFQLGVDTGTLHHRHPAYFAVWEKGAPTIEIHASPTDWAHGKDPLGVVDVADDEPFTGMVLAQSAEDWFERTRGNQTAPTAPDRTAMPDPEPDHPNPATRAYLRHGLPATLSDDKRAAWERHLAGQAVPLNLLPTNGDRCTAPTHSGSPAGCGFPLLIDGSCPNASEHTDSGSSEGGSGTEVHP